jgi:hypothetical protein
MGSMHKLQLVKRGNAYVVGHSSQEHHLNMDPLTLRLKYSTIARSAIGSSFDSWQLNVDYGDYSYGLLPGLCGSCVHPWIRL